MNIFVNADEDRLRTGWRLAGQLFLMYIIGMVLIWLVSRFFSFSGPLIPTSLIAIGALVSLMLAARGLDKRRWSDFGLSFSPADGKEYGIGFLTGGAAMALIFLIEYATGWLEITGFGWNHPFHHTAFATSFIVFFLFMVLIGFYEELIFRGYQIVNLSEGFNQTKTGRANAVISAVIFSSVIFGLMHIFNPASSWISTLNVALAGVMLAFPFIITGRLSLSIGLHIGWNFCQGGVFGFPVSGLPERTSLIQIHQQGPVFMTGGGFGPEAGLLGILGIGLIILGMYWYLRKSQHPLNIHPRLGIYRPSARNYPA